MLAMTAVVASNPLAQLSGADLKSLKKIINTPAKRQRLDPRQLQGFPFVDYFVRDKHAAEASKAATPSKIPSQECARPGSTPVFTANGPLLFPVDKKGSGQVAAESQPSSPSIPSSQQKIATSPPGPSNSQLHNERVKKLTRLSSPPGSAKSWHYWTRRQAPSDVEDNDSTAFLAANPSKVKNSVGSHQICGAGSICNSITIAGEGNNIHAPLPQMFQNLPHAATVQRSRHSSPSPEPSGTASDPSRPTASSEVQGRKHLGWSHIEEMLHFTRRMAPRPVRVTPQPVITEANTAPAGPANIATNSQVCGPSSICHSNMIANGNGNILQVPKIIPLPQQELDEMRPPRGNSVPPTPTPPTPRHRASPEPPDTNIPLNEEGLSNELPINGRAANGIYQGDSSTSQGDSSQLPLRRRQMEGGRLGAGTGPAGVGLMTAAQPSGPAPNNHATNSQRCGKGGVCKSVFIANGNSNTVNPSPQHDLEAAPQRARVESLRSDASAMQGDSPIIPAQTVFQPTREMYPPSQAESPFMQRELPTPVPGAPASVRTSIKKEYRGSRSSGISPLPRRQVFRRSFLQHSANPAMTGADSSPQLPSEPPSQGLTSPSSTTTVPTQTSLRVNYRGRYPGRRLFPTGRPSYTFWPDGTASSGEYRPRHNREDSYGKEGRLAHRMMPGSRAKPVERSPVPEETQSAAPAPEPPANILSNHQTCGSGSVCHNMNIAGNGVTVNNRASTYENPGSRQSEPNIDGSRRQYSHGRGSVPNQAFTPPPPPPPPPPPGPPPVNRAARYPHFWAKAGPKRAGRADEAPNWRAGRGYGQTTGAARQHAANGDRPRFAVDVPPRVGGPPASGDSAGPRLNLYIPPRRPAPG